MNSSVLFLVFNRPATTAQVFQAIRAAKPPRLYIAADGPRASRPDDAVRCEAVRNIVSSVDWPCTVTTLFRDHNLGCRQAVSGALDWFFQNEEEGIVLEDDVLPVSGFFDYCDELLQRFRNDPRIGLISGCNLVSSELSTTSSYFFSRNCHIWGWATWRRVWKQYDVAMGDWPAWKTQRFSDVPNAHALFKTYWTTLFDQVHSGRIDTWDYQLVFNLWRHRQLCVLPAVNLTANLGFGADGTHTRGHVPGYVTRSKPTEPSWPLVHPELIATNAEADRLIDRLVYGLGFTTILSQKLKVMLRRLFRR